MINDIKVRSERKRILSQPVAQGLLASALVALGAEFLSDHYGAPAMLMALLLGIAFNFLAEEGRCVIGIGFASRSVLRFGVALLGVRISVELLVQLGPALIGLIVAGVLLTIAFGVLLSRLLGRGWNFGVLTGGSVAICGASAAMAIAAILPRNEDSERDLTFTVLAVTVLSTLAMIIYPMIANPLNLDRLQTGVFLGGTIHDVAQVIGAGFSVSDKTGEIATLVKLIRVTMLAPVIFALVVLGRRKTISDLANKRPPLVPGFVVIFIALATINSLGLIPKMVQNTMNDVSRWSLLTAMAAVGMKTSLRSMLDVGGQAIIMIVAETAFLAVFVTVGTILLGT